MTATMTGASLAGRAVTMPNAIQFAIHDALRARRASTDFDLATAVATVGVLAEGATVHLLHVGSTDALVGRETPDPDVGWR